MRVHAALTASAPDVHPAGADQVLAMCSHHSRDPAHLRRQSLASMWPRPLLQLLLQLSPSLYHGMVCELLKGLFLGRKAMTNLDSILRSRDIALLTKVHLVKVMFFPVVVTYGCKSWTIMKAEC